MSRCRPARSSCACAASPGSSGRWLSHAVASSASNQEQGEHRLPVKAGTLFYTFMSSLRSAKFESLAWFNSAADQENSCLLRNLGKFPHLPRAIVSAGRVGLQAEASPKQIQVSVLLGRHRAFARYHASTMALSTLPPNPSSKRTGQRPAA